MKRLLHTTILALTITSYGLPALADSDDRACPKPPEAVYYAVDAAWPDQVTEIHWDDPDGTDGSRDSSLSVTLWRKKPLLWKRRNPVEITCRAVRQVWNPDCYFNILIIPFPWDGPIGKCLPSTTPD